MEKRERKTLPLFRSARFFRPAHLETSKNDAESSFSFRRCTCVLREDENGERKRGTIKRRHPNGISTSFPFAEKADQTPLPHYLWKKRERKTLPLFRSARFLCFNSIVAAATVDQRKSENDKPSVAVFKKAAQTVVIHVGYLIFCHWCDGSPHITIL